jgi:hypothetical protein
VPRFRVAGPFGPYDLLGFDEDLPAGAVGPMAERYDLGPLRGERATRDVDARGCTAHLGDGPIAEGGTTYAEAFVDVPAAGAYLVRLDTPNAAELRVDGAVVVRRDTRREALAQESYHRVELAAGRHELGIKVSTRHPNPAIGVSILPLDEAGAAWLAADAAPAAGASGDDALAGYLAGARALLRGDLVGARELFGEAVRRGGASAPLLVLQSSVVLSDPLRSPDMRRDSARRVVRALARKDPSAWYAVLQGASLAAAEGRVAEAAQSLREGLDRFPRVPAFYLTLADLLLSRGWDAESDRVIDRLAEVAPDACTTIDAQLGGAQRLERTAAIEALAGRAVACDARSDARFGFLVRARRWDEASAELERLAALEPLQARTRLLGAALSLAEGRGDREGADRVLAELAAARPRSETALLRRVDHALAGGQRDRAIALLAGGIAAEPATYVGLRPFLAELGGPADVLAYRRDGLEAVRRYLADPPPFDQPQVLVLDYTAVRIYEDGSSVSLVQQVTRAQSEEAVDALGEFQVPEGAELLRLRTIKADGTVLEPDLIEGKETLSLPGLAMGDFVEYELLLTAPPSSGLGGAALGERFYFQSFEQPFRESELLLVAPQDLELALDPRGPAPEPTIEARGDVRLLRFHVENSEPLVQEPSSIAFREFIPSVNWSIDASWERLVGGVRDALVERDVVDPAARRLVARILGSAGASDEAKAKKLYEWVLENVESSNDLFGASASMLAARTGNPARVLHYLFGLAGIPSELVIVRDYGADQTQSEIADEETYSNLLLEAELQGQKTYLFTGARGAPFGYVPASLAGMDGLVLDRSARRVTLPAAAAGQDRRAVRVEGELAADGSAHLRVEETYYGAGAIAWRESLEGIPAAELDERFEEVYAAQLFPSARLERLEIDGRDTPEAPVVLRYTLDVAALGHREGASWVVPTLLPLDVGASLTRAPERRTAQVVMPVDAEVSITLTLPGDAARAELPASVSVEGPNGARFAVETERDGATVRFVRTLAVPRMRIAPERYPELVRFGRRADGAEARPIRVSMGR